jgi:hypothetical protein
MSARICTSLLVSLSLLVATAAWAEDVNDNALTKTIDCAGGKVSVNGNDNKITVTGSCRELSVMGNQNSVTIESVSLISVMGNQNKVVWKRAEGQKKPSVNNLGVKNSVKKG